MKTPLLNVSNLHVTFRTQGKFLHAVRGINFKVYEEQIVGIVGESGCGKSAAVKALIQLLPSHTTTIDGTITYQEKNLLELSEKQMQKMRGKEIGMIFQDPMSSLNPTM